MAVCENPIVVIPKQNRNARTALNGFMGQEVGNCVRTPSVMMSIVVVEVAMIATIGLCSPGREGLEM